MPAEFKSMRTLRKEKGLTQNDIAEKLNIHQSAYSNWENGYQRPCKKYWEPLAQLLGVTVEELAKTFPGHPPAFEYKKEH